MDLNYAKFYKELYKRHWWWRAREQIILQNIKAHFQVVGRELSILDIGCGDGLFFEQLQRFGYVEGIEPDTSIVTVQGRSMGTIHEIPFECSFQPGKKYDLILLLDVIEHIDDDYSFLQHAVELLSDVGQIIITVPAFMILWTTHDDINEHKRRYKKGSLAALARRAHLHIESQDYFFVWIGIVKLLLHCLGVLGCPIKGQSTIPPMWINSMLTRVSVFEYQVLKHFHLPFGNSIVLVGRSKN